MIVKKYLYANETNHEKVSITDTFFCDRKTNINNIFHEASNALLLHLDDK